MKWWKLSWTLFIGLEILRTKTDFRLIWARSPILGLLPIRTILEEFLWFLLQNQVLNLFHHKVPPLPLFLPLLLDHKGTLRFNLLQMSTNLTRSIRRMMLILRQVVKPPVLFV